MLMAWLRHWLLPRVVFLPFWAMWLVPVPFGLSGRARRRQGAARATMLCIEAGVRGWDSIEFKELHLSACEYLGDDRVYKLAVSKDESYLRQVKKALDEVRPTHYLYDPRTGSQGRGAGLWQTLGVAWLLHVRGVIPIVLLTNLAVRTWRAQSALVSARRGTVIAFVSPGEISPIFPHRRLVAPSLMALSQTTMRFLDELFEKRPGHPPRKAVFVGSLYEPRISTLRAIAERLASRGYALEIRGRELGSARFPDLDYWSLLSHSSVIITTADQVDSKNTDWQWIKYMVYRYIEVLASGALLVAPEVPGIRRFFVPGEHFASFTSAEHASKVIEYYLENEAERAKIARQGRAQAQALIRARTFWVGVDVGLGKDSLT